MTVQKIDFQAKWDQTNAHLEAPIPTTTQKVRHIAWNVLSLLPFIGLPRLFSYAVGSLANRMTLPAARYVTLERLAEAERDFSNFWQGPITAKNRLARAHFTAEERTIATPDGATLHVKFLRHKEANAETPTVIYFNGNFELALEDPNPWQVRKSIEKKAPSNFVFFDYRGVGHSTGKFNAAKDLLIDGSSIVQWVRDDLKTAPHLIHFYGKSLGGAVAVQTQALDAEHLIGRHLNERSFASSEKMVEAIFGSGCFGKLLTRIFADQGYGADAAAAFRKLQGRTFVVYHPKDRVIPYDASLQNAVQNKDFLCLEAFSPDLKTLSDRYHHNALLEWHEGATDRMAEFLFRS